MLTRVAGDARPVLGIHHARKDNPNEPRGKNKSPDPRQIIRGASAIYDGVIGAFVFIRDREDQDSPIRVHHVKERMRGRRIDTFGFCVRDVAKDGDTHWGLVVEFVEAEALKVAPARDSEFEARCVVVFEKIRSATPEGIAVNRLASQTRIGDKRVKQCLERLLKANCIEGKEEKRGRVTTTFYFATSDKYEVAARSNGVALDDEPTHTNGVNGTATPVAADQEHLIASV